MNENYIDLKISDFLTELGAGKPTPGAGTVAALQGLGAAKLVITVIRLTEEKRPRSYSEKLPGLLKLKAELEDRLVPQLERLFQEDSEKFATVIRLRNERDRQTEAAIKRQKATEADSALRIATEVPLQIARACVEVSRFALEAFDHGFNSARGDSAVAIQAAVSSVAGCLSVIHVNLRSLGDDAWTEGIRVACADLLTQQNDLHCQETARLSHQVELSQRNSEFLREIKDIIRTLKGRPSLADNDIEQIAIRLQRTIWKFQDLIWKNYDLKNAVEALDSGKVLGRLGFEINRPDSLGKFRINNRLVEVAGEIDQKNQTVSISSLFPSEIQNFTAAHELGHYLLHSPKEVLHRDLPLDGSHSTASRSPVERQADKFASYFLMPKKLLRNVFFENFSTETFRITPDTATRLNGKSAQDLRAKCRNLRDLSRLLAETTYYDFTSMKSLSTLFNVSTEAMAIRLEELGLVEF